MDLERYMGEIGDEASQRVGAAAGIVECDVDHFAQLVDDRFTLSASSPAAALSNPPPSGNNEKNSISAKAPLDGAVHVKVPARIDGRCPPSTVVDVGDRANTFDRSASR